MGEPPHERDRHARGPALPAGDRQRAAFPDATPSPTARTGWCSTRSITSRTIVDATLSYRWSCHMAVCGSCGMMINGEPKLSCHAFLRDYRGRRDPDRAARSLPDRARPGDRHGQLHGEAVEREALSDPEAGEAARATANICRRRSQLMAFKQYTQCINCLLCYAACPQCGLNDDFIGPAALALAHRYNLDSRDGGKDAARRRGGQQRGHLGVHLRRRLLGGLPQARRSRRRDPADQDFRLARLVQGAAAAGSAAHEPPALCPQGRSAAGGSASPATSSTCRAS